MCVFPPGVYNKAFQMQISYQWTYRGQDKEGENDIKLILSHLRKPEELKLLN